jgi:hypothetical protein
MFERMVHWCAPSRRQQGASFVSASTRRYGSSTGSARKTASVAATQLRMKVRARNLQLRFDALDAAIAAFSSCFSRGLRCNPGALLKEILFRQCALFRCKSLLLPASQTVNGERSSFCTGLLAGLLKKQCASVSAQHKRATVQLFHCWGKIYLMQCYIPLEKLWSDFGEFTSGHSKQWHCENSFFNSAVVLFLHFFCKRRRRALPAKGGIDAFRLKPTGRGKSPHLPCTVKSHYFFEFSL